jgi:hypothetical protein
VPLFVWVELAVIVMNSVEVAVVVVEPVTVAVTFWVSVITLVLVKVFVAVEVPTENCNRVPTKTTVLMELLIEVHCVLSMMAEIVPVTTP